jgi:hypothetical protein
MIKSVVMFNLPDLNDLPLFERWYLRMHGPEVMARFQPWQSRYVSYRAVEAPAGAERFGSFNYRLTEIWWRELPGYPTDALCFDMTEAETRQNSVVSFDLPPQATEDLLGGFGKPEDGTILRWVNVLRYPDGVTPEEGDAWYLKTHAPELMQQPRLTRFFSSGVIPPSGPLAGWKPTEEDLEAGPPPVFHRYSELWYRNFDDWKESVLNTPVSYTPPPWAQQDTYPFLMPYENFISMFILESPSNDFHKELHPYV